MKSRIFFYSTTFIYRLSFCFYSRSSSLRAWSMILLSKSSRSFFFFSFRSFRILTCWSRTSRTSFFFLSYCAFLFLIYSKWRRCPNFCTSPHSSSLISDGMSSTSTASTLFGNLRRVFFGKCYWAPMSWFITMFLGLSVLGLLSSFIWLRNSGFLFTKLFKFYGVKPNLPDDFNISFYFVDMGYYGRSASRTGRAESEIYARGVGPF